MKKHLNSQLKKRTPVWAALSLPLLLSSCMNGFQLENLNSFSKQDLTSNSSSPTQTSLKLIENKAALPGWLTDTDFTQFSSASQTFEGVIKIPSYWLLEAGSFAVKKALPFSCRLTPLAYEGDPSRYNPGEIPCGAIQNDGRKFLTQVDVERISERDGSFQGTIEAFSIPIMLGRQQYQGSYQETRLDSLGVENLTSSLEAGQDISFRYQPNANGRAARIEACLNLPGSDISSLPITVRAKAKAFLGFWRPSYAGNFQINPGQARFNYLRGCFATDIEFQEGGFVPQLKFVATQNPFAANGQYQGFTVRAEDWWLRLFDRMLDWFRASVRRQGQKLAIKEGNKYIDKEIETGKWFQTAKGQEILDKSALTVNKAIVKAFHNSGMPLSTSDLRFYLRRQCSLLSWVKEIEGVKIDTKDLCERTIDKVNLSILPFYRDPVLAQQGCYDHFANIHQTRTNGKLKTWAKKCGLSIKAQLRVENPLNQQELALLNELVGSMDSLVSRIENAIQSVGNLQALLRNLTNGQSLANVASLIMVLNQLQQSGANINSLEQFLSLAGSSQQQTAQNILNYVLN